MILSLPEILMAWNWVLKKSPILVQNNRIKIVGRSKLMDDFLYLTLNISYMKRNDSKNSPVFWEKSEWSIIKIQKGWVRHDPEIILSSCHIGDSGYVAKHASFPKKRVNDVKSSAQWVNKSPDFWWVHFHPISHFCSVVNHGKTKFVTLDYIVKKFSLFYDSPLIRCVTPALISWNIPKGKFPKGSYKNILWRKKIETSAYGLRFSNFLEWTQMEFMILLHRYS